MFLSANRRLVYSFSRIPQCSSFTAKPWSLVSSLSEPGQPKLRPSGVTGLPSVSSLHQPFSVTLFYAGPVCLVLITHSFDCRGVIECVTVLQCSIVVLHSVVYKQATPRTSLPCAHKILTAGCPPEPHRNTADSSITECVTMLQCYTVVLQSGITQATLRPSLPCARAIPEAVCPPAPLRDTADRSPADIAPVRSGYCSGPDFAHMICPLIVGFNYPDQFIIST